MRSSSATDATRFARLTERGRVTHQPGLDGLRGLAVAAVVVFHTGLGWLPGGYLGVSLFFTISGTVIGTVILHEIEQRSAFSLRGFWLRRARRLFPAAWVVLTVVAVLRVTSTVFASTTAGDLVASWLQVANWHFLVDDTSYADLFGGPSAVLHFWSLAIEEQFYLAVGAAAVVLARRSSRPAEHLAIAAAGLALVSFAMPVVLSFGVDRTYYGTDTRAGELLVGLAIAGVIADPARRRRVLAVRRRLAIAASAALGVAVVLWRVLEPGDDGLRTWVLPASALVSCALVVGALVPGPLQLLVTWRPLRRLGDISYALYLLHWPVFLALRHANPDAGVIAFAVATAVAVGLAVLSTVLVEAPVRLRRLPRRWVGVAAAALVGCTAVAMAIPAQRSDADDVLDELERAAGDGALTSSAPPGSMTPEQQALPRVGFFGDSIGFSLAFSLSHAADDAAFTLDEGLIRFGCGIAVTPYMDDQQAGECAAMVDDMVRIAGERDLEGVVVVSCQWELLAQPLPGSSEERTAGDPMFDDHVREAFGRAAERLHEAGVEHVMWLRCPRLSREVHQPDLRGELLASRDPARVDALNRIIDDLGAAGVIEVLDLATWVEPRIDDPSLRADGSHFVYEQDTGVAAELTRLINERLAA